MGVPKFFQFIIDRYPSISNIVNQCEIPQYDNLYLDMNSIIHTCSHPRDLDAYFCIGKKNFSDEDIFKNVSIYVERIFRFVKPIDIMFLAFDGVAPRAKMNQQRAHRFRVHQNFNKSMSIGESVLNDKLFDANCITPGTIFMAELIKSIKHFVAFKVSNDPLWQKCKIIVSGPEVAGEGEHKIMEFIRYSKTQLNYNHNTRHCLYSLDSDLIILGLCIHEPHFSLLRENIMFNRTNMILMISEQSSFHLLHLSLVRKYLQYEFISIKNNLKFPFDLEKIIDDWVLLGFLVGNDFIPQLPYFSVVNGTLPFLYKVYIKTLPTLDGYINEAGILHINRFMMFLEKLIEMEKDINETKKRTECYSVKESKINFIDNAFALVDIGDGVKFDESNDHETFCLTDLNCTKSNHTHFETKRSKYYEKKFKFNTVNKSFINTLVGQYVKAIQWILNYYYHGCCSWSWFYPYHYAPLVSDLVKYKNFTIKFEMGKPFLPLQHLVAVLPSSSAHLLPSSLQSLLTDSKSPIINFYPENFECDMDGKVNDWEAVVLIPFINEKQLLDAMEIYVSKLSTKELERNILGLVNVFSYTEISLGQYPVDTIFEPFINHAQVEYVEAKKFSIAENKLLKGLCPNVQFDPSFPGFPTLEYIPHTHSFTLRKLKFVSEYSANTQRIILNVHAKHTSNLGEIAAEFLGRTVYINWPYLQEAYVIGVTDSTEKIFLLNIWKKYSKDNLKMHKLSDSAVLSIKNDVKDLFDMYAVKFGINIGETEIVLHVFPRIGNRYVYQNAGKVQIQVKWASLCTKIPYQLIIKEENIKHRINVPVYKSITDIFTSGAYCFMIRTKYYGAMGIVKQILMRQQQIMIALSIVEEPNLVLSNEFFMKERDLKSSRDIAKKLNLNNILISRISGSLIVTEGSENSKEFKIHDIGLHMKLSKRKKELFGYTKLINNTWHYSNKAVKLIKSYFDKFPDLFQNIAKNLKLKSFSVSDLFPGKLNELNRVKAWISEQKIIYPMYLNCDTETLSFYGVLELKKIVSTFLQKQKAPEVIEMKVPPQFLFKPDTITDSILVDPQAQHKLLDRVVCVRVNFTVPLGLKGYIVGIQKEKDKWKTMYDIFFDSPFIGGSDLCSCSEHRCFRLSTSDFLNIDFGKEYVQNNFLGKKTVPNRNPNKK